MIPIDIVHKFDNKVPHELKIPILNTNNNIANKTKNTVLVSLRTAEKSRQHFQFGLGLITSNQAVGSGGSSGLTKTQEQVHDLLPKMPQTNLQLEADKPKHPEISTPDAEVPKNALNELQHLLEAKYSTIVSKSATDIGRTNLIELDIPTEDPSIACKPYSVPLKYRDFIDHEMKQLEDAAIISHLMSNWASPILVMPKKPDPNASSTKNNKQLNLRLCIDYCKLNNRILTAKQIKADGGLCEVVANYPLPTIDNLLASFKD